MRSIEIIQLRSEHLERLVIFFDLINLPEYKINFTPHSFDKKNADIICNYIGKDKYFAVLLDKEQIIAYFMLRGWDEGYTIPSLGLCILKEYQHLGLGKTIINFLEVLAKINGCSKIMLKVKKTNIIAKKLYARQGYVFSDFDKDYVKAIKCISRRTLV
jgi:ribosomal protein S18 acetylase RimI-like enzyme